MKTLTLNIPDSVDLTEEEAMIMLAANLYQKEKLSLGQAAQVARLSKRDFMEILSRFNVSLFNEDPAELENDIRNAAGYNI